MPILGRTNPCGPDARATKMKSQRAKRENGASEDAIDFVNETDNNFDFADIAS